ncbi:MAG: proton-conducting transporter membrane subunit [Methanoregula sp.]|uniref:NADH-quinone oxidoreductase subunit N n=1 Tax=Methanoregula sp. TaxID=2052170 RepID=UPI003D0C5324
MIPADIAAATPLVVAMCGIAIYFITKILPQNLRHWSGTLTALILLGTFFILLSVIARHASLSPLSFTGITGGLLVTGIGAVSAWASEGSLDPKGPVYLYYPLFLFALAGAMAIGFANDLFTIFVMVELSAIPVYALCAYRHKEDPAALSSAMKYMLQGVVGTLTALFGVAILYLIGHTLDLSELPKALAGADPSLVIFAAILILLGYGVKLGIVPLHTWLPDAYARAPVGVTAIMVGPTKIGVLIALFLTLSALPAGGIPKTIGILVIFFAILTMTAGNLLALNQRDLRYVLAYSSVAQTGYILLGFGIGMVYNLPLGFAAGLYYAIAYAMMKAGAFIATDTFARDAGSYEIAQMRGLGAKHSLLGISFDIFIFGLSGVPFTAGFLGKLLLVQAGMATAMMSGVVLALVLVLNSALSLGYYVPIISTLMFYGKESDRCPVHRITIPFPVVTAVVFLAIVTVYFGLFPESFTWISHAAGQIFTWGVA